MLPDSLYNSCIRDWESVCFSNNRVLSVQLHKNSMPRQNEWWYQVWMKQKFEHQRIQNETKLPLRKSLSQKVMIRSLRESRIWILVRIMNHWGKNDRNHEYQDSNDSASTPNSISFTHVKNYPTVEINSYGHLLRAPRVLAYEGFHWKLRVSW